MTKSRHFCGGWTFSHQPEVELAEGCWEGRDEVPLSPHWERQPTRLQRLRTAPSWPEGGQCLPDRGMSLQGLRLEGRFPLDWRLGQVVWAELEGRPVGGCDDLLGLHFILRLVPQERLVQRAGLLPGGPLHLLSGGPRHTLEEAGEVPAEAEAAHGDQCRAQDDVEAGQQDAEEVSVAVQGDSDGDQEGEGVEQGVYHVGLVEVGHENGAQQEVHQEDQQTHPGRHPLLPVLRLPAAEEPVVQTVVQSLQVAGQQSPHQADVQQEYRQSEGRDTNR